MTTGERQSAQLTLREQQAIAAFRRLSPRLRRIVLEMLDELLKK
jgi:hypothetical protein